MSSSYEVISAFLDAEPFDAEELDRALSEPAGRALLIDLATLRRIVQPVDVVPALRSPNPLRPPAARSVWRTAAAAAALVLALTGGYLAGERRAATASADPPAPTRIVQAVPFIPSGGMQ